MTDSMTLKGLVLATYARALDPDHPVICMDGQPVQRVKETRQPIPATKQHPQRVDYDYERAGTACVFMFCEPLSGGRQATAREQRTKTDWAHEVAALLDGRYAACGKVTLVCDNLNTHTRGPSTKPSRRSGRVTTCSASNSVTRRSTAAGSISPRTN